MPRTAALLVALALAPPALADTVHLANGNKFEEVIAERRDGQVRIRMPDGEIVLPEGVVSRVERSRSVWEEFSERQRRLASEQSAAAAWLELARWASEVDFRPGMERAALRAAELDPTLDGLDGLMRRLGRIFDPVSEAWLSEKEYMERRGYVLWGDRWLPREAYLARLQEHQERESRRRDEDRQERITRAIEALAVAEIRRSAAPAPRPATGQGGVVASFPGAYFPVVRGFGATVAVGPAAQLSYKELSRRQPGSLFPIRQPRVQAPPIPPRPRHLTSRD